MEPLHSIDWPRKPLHWTEWEAAYHIFSPLLPGLELGLSRWMEGWLQKLGKAVMKIKQGSVLRHDGFTVKRTCLHTLLSPCMPVSQLSRHWTGVAMSVRSTFLEAWTLLASGSIAGKDKSLTRHFSNTLFPIQWFMEAPYLYSVLINSG